VRLGCGRHSPARAGPRTFLEHRCECEADEPIRPFVGGLNGDDERRHDTVELRYGQLQGGSVKGERVGRLAVACPRHHAVCRARQRVESDADLEEVEAAKGVPRRARGVVGMIGECDVRPEHVEIILIVSGPIVCGISENTPVPKTTTRRHPHLEPFGDRVRQRRQELGLSQEALGQRAGLHPTYIGGIERGERNLSLHNILKVARALEIDAGELMRGLTP